MSKNHSALPMDLLIISEYRPNSGGPTGEQVGHLCDHIKAHCPDIRVRLMATRHRYHPGSFSANRIRNQIQMAVQLPFFLLFHKIVAKFSGRQGVVLATSLPVNFHILTLMGCRLTGLPTALWLWDVHPELEARLARRRGWDIVAWFLSWADRRVTGAFDAIIVLDRAMAADVSWRTQYAKRIEVVIPWSTYVEPAREVRVSGASTRLRMIYAGNYGYAHDLSPLARALRAGKFAHGNIEICFVGMPAAAVAVLKEQFAGVPAQLHFWPRFESFGELVKQFEHFDLGIVSLAQDIGGLCCPSKALTYVSCGLPILYVGPERTLSAEICEKGFGLTLEQLVEGWGKPLDQLIVPTEKKFPNPFEHSLTQMEDILRQVAASRRGRLTFPVTG